MARAGRAPPQSDQRLSDHIALAALTRVFTPEVVDAVLVEHGRVERRNRVLPARVVVYYVLALALFASCSYEEVMRKLVSGLGWISGRSPPTTIPTKAALFQARRRLGSEPLRALYEKVAVSLFDARVPGSSYRSWRLMSLHASTIDVPASEANIEHFSRPMSSRPGRGGALPQVRVLWLVECGSRAIIDAALGTREHRERELTESVVRSLYPGMLLLADRAFFSYRLWELCRSYGADLLWRVRSDSALPVERRYPDGSFASHICPGMRAAPKDTDGTAVRVVEFVGTAFDADTDRDHERIHRLLTTILDPEAAPAGELAELYSQRRYIGLETYQPGRGVVLRSKTPDGVIQEIYGHLCVHYAIRSLLRPGADRVSR
ncbi:IS4 family transposase [Nocardia bhagyanarayanae]|uniref:IS4 family transposase n=1 Tax=Nocardia bhagyanarayanae TaxID=1215925 RepID=A0A543FGK7_9NOCA|nr:IS4 family transposase [Nocardia bhagyanarayanae]TQM33000.1 IS4 family transposase [Nocardia bhagyanarayanae]